MMYQFEDVETGEPAEFDIPMAEAPDFGAVIRRNKRQYRRLLTTVFSVPVVSSDIYRNFQSAIGTEQTTGADHYDAKGRPFWTSKHRAAEWAKKKKGEGILDIALEE